MSQTRSLRRRLARNPPALRHPGDWLIEAMARPPKPTASYKLTPEALTALLSQGGKTAQQRFYDEVLGEPFTEAEKEPPC